MKAFLFRMFSCVLVTVSAEKTEWFLNLFLKNRLNSWGYHKADGTFCFYTTKRDLALIREEAEKGGILLNEGKPLGLFPHLWKKRARLGLLFGAVLSLFLFFCASSVVWDVRISGNEKMSDAEVRAELSAAGLGIGTRMDSFDRMHFTSSLLSRSENLSFVGVNFHGTVAYVQVMEQKKPEKDKAPVGGANLVASTDAIIESLGVVRGDPVVARGDVVRAGDLLVSGVTDWVGGSHFVYAAGEILGRVEHSLEVTVPRTRPEKIESAERMIGISVNFFGKNINIYRDTGNLPAEYVTIDRETPFVLKEGCTLPFSLSVEYAAFDRYKERRFSDAETVRYAEELMKNKLSAEMQGRELLEKSMQGTFQGDTYVLTCRVIALENIARVSEFSIFGEAQ